MVTLRVWRTENWVHVDGPDGWDVGGCAYDFWRAIGGAALEQDVPVIYVLAPQEVAEDA